MTVAKPQLPRRRKKSLEIIPPSDESEIDDDALIFGGASAVASARAVPESDVTMQDRTKRDNDTDALLNEDVPTNIASSSKSASLPAKPRAPSHRERAANPLVKMVDDFQGMDHSPIAAKARAIGATAATADDGRVMESDKREIKPAPRNKKPGPGRSSVGLKKNKASLLTFEKGALKTVKGKYTKPVEASPPPEDEFVAGMSTDIGDLGESSNAPRLRLTQAPPPGGEELLKLAGHDAQAAQELEDFEDDVTAVDVPVPTTGEPAGPVGSFLQTRYI